MTRNEYHAILIHKLERANSDIITFPGFAPGQMVPTVMMDELSQSSLTNAQHQPLIEELEYVSKQSDSDDFQERHDKFIQVLDTFNPDRE